MSYILPSNRGWRWRAASADETLRGCPANSLANVAFWMTLRRSPQADMFVRLAAASTPPQRRRPLLRDGARAAAKRIVCRPCGACGKRGLASHGLTPEATTCRRSAADFREGDALAEPRGSAGASPSH